MGQPCSIETRQKISDAKRGKARSAAHCAKLAEAAHALWDNPEYRQKQVQAHQTYAATPTGQRQLTANGQTTWTRHGLKPPSNVGNTLSEETRRKIAQTHLGMSNGPLSEEHRQKISLSLKGQKRGPCPEDKRRKIAAALTGRPAPSCGRPQSLERRQENREALLGKTLSSEHRQAISRGGRLAYQNGTRAYPSHSQGTRMQYADHVFRSSWEVAFAKWLDELGVIWQYEPRTFRLEGTTYLPDFYLPEYRKWVEIKGYAAPYSIAKVNAFRMLGHDIDILMRAELKELQVI